MGLSRISALCLNQPVKDLAQKIDHTLLRADATEKEISKLCEEAREYGFYSVCINGLWIPHVRRELAGSSVKICSVVGFPLGANQSKVKAYEAALALDHGAHEIDMVLPVGLVKSEQPNIVVEDIEAVLKETGSTPLKVIIETSLLSNQEKRQACEAIMRAGAAFVKTSTGFGGGGAEIEDIRQIRETVGSMLKIKASGGIRTYEQAKAMLEAGADRLGCSASVQILKESQDEV